MDVAAFPSSWLKGFLELGVLAVISRKETYGYEITRSLAEAGFGAVKGGTLYPILGRLEDSGLVATQWRTGDSGPGRKYYTLTDAGRSELAMRSAAWHSFANNLTHLLKESS